MPDDRAPRTVVLGVGNMLMADDGVGLAALERLRARWDVGDDAELVDGGTWGMNLLPVIERADRLLIFDAIDIAQVPGDVITLVGEQVPRGLAQKLSPHQVDLREVLALAEFRGHLPQELVALGVQPARVEMVASLTDVVAASLDRVVDLGVERLQAWGVSCRRAHGADVHA